MPAIFMSYRRADSGTATGRLYDDLGRLLGKRYLFKDLHNIDLGDDFREVINRSISECQIVLVMIGDQFTTVTDDQGVRRLFKENDYVCLEIASGLTLGKRVIPVLVEGAVMPGEDALPESLQQLPYQNAFELMNNRWKDDTRALAVELARHLDIKIQENLDRTAVLKWIGALSVYITAVIGLLIWIGTYWEARTFEHFVPLIFYVAPFLSTGLVPVSKRALLWLGSAWSMVYFSLLYLWISSDEQLEFYWYFLFLAAGLLIYYFVLPLISKKRL